MKIGFIGAGNMATALMRGAIRSTRYAPNDIIAYDIDEKKLDSIASELSVGVSMNTSRLIADIDILVLAVKPVVAPKVLSEMSGALSIKKPLIISIVAGQSLKKLEEMIGYTLPIIRVMPNLNAAVGASMSALCRNSLVTDDMASAAVDLLRCSGEVIELEERLFPVFDAVGGAAPAFCFMFVDALSRAAVKNGMSRELAYKTALKTVEGSIKLLRESGEHPWELVDRVCSPGGITIEGVISLQNSNLEASIAKAVDEVIKKDLSL